MSPTLPSRPLRIAVNATALADAGGRSVAINFLRAVPQVAPHHTFRVLAPAGVGYEAIEASNVSFEWVPATLRSAALRPFTDRFWVRRKIHAMAADVLFSMGNIGLNVGSIPQMLLVHWPYALYPESPVWKRMPFRELLNRRLRLVAFKRGLRHADLVCVQTETAKGRFLSEFGGPPTVVVPNAVTLTPSSTASATGALLTGRRSAIRLLVLSRYYPHKNLEVLLRLAPLLRRAAMDVQIVTTLHPSHGRGARDFLRAIADPAVGAVITNVGVVPMSQVPNLYAEVDGLLLPTLLESFSGTYVEAMHFGKTVLTSDLDFARDVCRDSAFYFDPMRPESIVKAISDAFGDTAELERKIRIGRKLLDAMPNWYEVSSDIVRHLESLQLRAPASTVREQDRPHTLSE